jgi:ABC-2 type transport system ATP-binding protein
VPSGLRQCARSIWYGAAVVAPLLELVRARIDVEGVPAVDGLSLVTGEDRVVVLGGPKVLFEAASGMRVPAHGEVRTRGVPARSAARSGVMAGAPCDPPFPPHWTVREYVTWSARIAGHELGDARALAEGAIAEMKMSAVAGAPLKGATTSTRRATSIAAALATGAEMILLEEPVIGLADDTARNFARMVLRALDKRAWAVFAARLPLESPFALDADEAVIVLGSRVVAQGAPGELAARDHAYAVRLLGAADDFARLAAARGARVSGHGPELTIDLGESLAVSDLLKAAAEARATVLELRPLSHAFA